MTTAWMTRNVLRKSKELSAFRKASEAAEGTGMILDRGARRPRKGRFFMGKRGMILPDFADISWFLQKDDLEKFTVKC